MRKKDKKMPIIRVVNGWEKKNFIIEQEEKYNRYWAIEDKEEYSTKKFEFVVKSWDFLDKLNCDVFISTWDRSVQINHQLNIYVDEIITEEKILNVLPEAKISILKESDYFDINLEDSNSDARNTNKMMKIRNKKVLSTDIVVCNGVITKFEFIRFFIDENDIVRLANTKEINIYGRVAN